MSGLVKGSSMSHNGEGTSRPQLKTVVISAFPCCGKTYAYQNYQDKYKILDSDSSQFSWVKDKDGNNTKVRNPEFPKNYIKHIKDNIGKVDIIFVSSHLIVRQALEDEGIHFITVYPEDNMLNEWVGRMYRRGSSESFIQFQIDHWDEFVKGVINEPKGDGLVRLGNNEYLSNLDAFIHFANE